MRLWGFHYAAPKVWNNLPVAIRQRPTPSTFQYRTNTWRGTSQEKIYRSRDGSPETDRFPVKSRPMC